MKITFLLTQDVSSPSGLGRYLPWAKELVRLGHEANIIALHPDFSNLSERKFFISGVLVEYAGQMHVKKQGSKKTYFSLTVLIWVALTATYQLFRAALAKPVDLLLVGKPHPMNSLAALIVKVIKPKVRLIVDCDDNEASSNRFNNQFQKQIIAWFETWVPKKAQFVTSNTYFTLNRLELLGVPRNKLVYVPNGIDEERFGHIDPANVEALRNQLGLPGKKVISYIGSMSLPSHPIDLLLKAFIYIEKEIPDVVLMLVGGGEDLDNLKSRAKELSIENHTLFIGRVDPDEVPNYYTLSHVSVDPVYDDDSAKGRCPLKMFESWACGVPFVTSGVGDRAHLAGDPPAASLAEPGNSKALANVIATILRDKQLELSLQKLGKEKVVNYFWKTLAKNFILLN